MRGIYLVTGRGLCSPRPLEEIVLQAVDGGVAYVQLREKDVSTRFFVQEAKRIKKLLSSYKIPLIINDRIDVALACGAEGVHIGQEDMPFAIARKLMGPKAIIGLSVEDWGDVEESQKLDVDYIGVSPVFPTPTKTDTKGAWGFPGLPKLKLSAAIRSWLSVALMNLMPEKSLPPVPIALPLYRPFAPRPILPRQPATLRA